MCPLILCVDDDSLVRDVTQAALERGGYRVLLAASGAEAASILMQAAESISLAILDWTLADVPTAEVVTRLKALQPGLKILITSGHDRTAVVPWIAKQRVDGFLPKPYLPKQLVQRVEWMLRPRRPCAASGSAF